MFVCTSWGQRMGAARGIILPRTCYWVAWCLWDALRIRSPLRTLCTHHTDASPRAGHKAFVFLLEMGKQTKAKETTGQLPIPECCKQSVSLQTTFQFLFPCSKIKGILAKEEAGMPAGALRRKKWWSSNSHHPGFSYPTIIFLEGCITVLQKDQDCSIGLWFGHGGGHCVSLRKGSFYKTEGYHSRADLIPMLLFPLELRSLKLT